MENSDKTFIDEGPEKNMSVGLRVSKRNLARSKG